MRWSTRHVNVKAEFLNEDIEGIIYIRNPYNLPCSNMQKIYLLHKSLYGLKTGPFSLVLQTTGIPTRRHGILPAALWLLSVIQKAQKWCHQHYPGVRRWLKFCVNKQKCPNIRGIQIFFSLWENGIISGMVPRCENPYGRKMPRHIADRSHPESFKNIWAQRLSYL